LHHTDGSDLRARRATGPARIGVAAGVARLAIALLGAALLAAPAQAARKALVIGNADYARATDLANPRNDAADVAARLAELGFEVSGGGPQLDLTGEEIVAAVQRFANSLAPGDTALFFFAGHGAQSSGESYLVPTDDDGIAYTDDLETQGYSVGALASRLASRPGVTSIVILDACRSNTLAARVDGRGAAPQGLGDVETSAGEVFVLYAAAKGKAASDGGGRNSPFTTALLAALENPDREIYELSKDVAQRVRQASDGAQVPRSSSTLVGAGFLTEGPHTAAASVVAAPPPPVGDLVVDGGALLPVVPLVTGYLPDPHRVGVLAGGDRPASQVDASCKGAISRWPNVILDYEAGDYALHIGAVSEGDAVLVVRDPAGRWTCSDDVDGLNPYLTLEDPVSGSYRIWVGVYDAATPAFGTELRVSEHGLVTDGGALQPLVTLTAGFAPDPLVLPVLAGGSVNAAMADEACVGVIARWPDFAVDYEAGGLPLHFSVVSAADTVLVAADPSGAISCNDDAGGPEAGVNPAVTFEEPLSGRYRVWIGTLESVAEAPEASLLISELGQQFSEPARSTASGD
jgi:hypothetical protein